MTADAKISVLAVIAIALMVSSWMGEVTATSQYLNDASFTIVDPVLTAPLNTSQFGPFIFSSETLSTEYLIENFNPLSGFNQPLVLRGDDSLDTTTGIFKINDDGYYVFVIHSVGVDYYNPDLTLTRIPADTTVTTNETLATIKDLGAGLHFTTCVVAELNRNDRVLIANILGANVVGTEDNPFIYSAFLLYHKPITSTPKVRQSAFSVIVHGYNSISDEVFVSYNPPALDINGDFNNETGTFTTSIKGLYVFHLSVIFKSYATMVVRAGVAIFVNGSTRTTVQVQIDTARYIQSAGATISVPMSKGDTAQLRNAYTTPDTYCVATFAGYLLA